MELFLLLGSIMLVNLVLSGDNAVVIALACRSLPAKQQKKAIFWGTLGAVVLRVVLTVAAAYLLQIPYLMSIGGLALVYIAIKLLIPEHEHEEEHAKTVGSLYEAIKIILVADVIMSLDNVLAIAGIADGHLGILIAGLALSIPIVVFGSTILMNLMNKYPVIIYAGAGVLGWTAGKMIVHDTSLAEMLVPASVILEIGLAVFVLAAGFWLKSRKKRSQGRLPA